MPRAIRPAGAILAALLLSAPAWTQDPSPPSGPAAPRWPDGHVQLGPPPGETGLWVPIDARLSVPDAGTGRGPGAPPDAPRYPNLKYSEVPFQPWARALLDYRLENPFEPHARCKPSGGARQPITPYGIELVEIPELQRIYLIDQGGPQSYRIIYMDGRNHPDPATPGYYGHSVGRWDADTLVVDSVGFNERFWMDREGMPHTDELHLVERFTRKGRDLLLYEVTVEDPGAYTEPWSGGFYMNWTPDTELFEYICQDNNLAADLMIGRESSVDRSSRIAP